MKDRAKVTRARMRWIEEQVASGKTPPNEHVRSLCDGAARLVRQGNHAGAVSLLRAAVALDPNDFIAHRRLAAALVRSGDREGAADEYARFIELRLEAEDTIRAAKELAYARVFLGDMAQLRPAATYLMTLGDAATIIGPAVRRPAPADVIATVIPAASKTAAAETRTPTVVVVPGGAASGQLDDAVAAKRPKLTVVYEALTVMALVAVYGMIGAGAVNGFYIAP